MLTCEVCGNEFQPRASNLRRGYGRICSRSCSGKIGGKNNSLRYADLRLRLEANFTRNGDECWPWRGAVTNHGYGVISVGGRSVYAHKALYEDEIGKVPKPMVLDHQCHNRSEDCRGGDSCPHRRCMNLSHMEVSRQRDNLLRSRHTQAHIRHFRG